MQLRERDRDRDAARVSERFINSMHRFYDLTARSAIADFGSRRLLPPKPVSDRRIEAIEKLAKGIGMSFHKLTRALEIIYVSQIA